VRNSRFLCQHLCQIGQRPSHCPPSYPEWYSWWWSLIQQFLPKQFNRDSHPFKTHSIESTPYDASPTRPAAVYFADLSTPFEASVPAFDWILRPEVGQHLSTDSENIFIDNVAGHANFGIVMSWAVPGWNGHVNERPNDWVIEQLHYL